MPINANRSKAATLRTPEEAVGQHAASLSEENAQLRHAVRSHAVVDQAIGVLLAVGTLTPDQGWDVLREVSQRTNIKLRHVAELLVEWARTGKLAADIQTELDQQLVLRKAPDETGA
ncbi:ANTAR domain-containing protein [Streptomyces sp. NPDC055056]